LLHPARNFFVRFFVGYVPVAAVAVLMAMKLFSDQFVPGVRQSVPHRRRLTPATSGGFGPGSTHRFPWSSSRPSTRPGG